MTAAQAFCQRQGISPGHFETIAFRRSLYPHARLLHGIVGFFQADFFTIDRELVRAAGGTASSREFRLEEQEFHSHPENSSILRRYLLLRLSTRRLHQVLFPSSRRASSAAPISPAPVRVTPAALDSKSSRS